MFPITGKHIAGSPACLAAIGVAEGMPAGNAECVASAGRETVESVAKI